MPFTGLLVEKCTIYRPSTATRDNMVTSTTWTKQSENIACRPDFVHDYRSRIEVVQEEYMDRSHGVVWVDPTVDLRSRDVVVFDGLPGQQYDVQFVDPLYDSVAIHHKRAVISERDEVVAVV